MSLNPTGAVNYNWNYSNPEKEGYSTVLTGTVVSLQEVQKRDYIPGSNQPGSPKFWPEGNPMMNIRMGLAMPDGSLKAFTFQPAGKDAREGKKPSVHMDLFELAGGQDMLDLIGKTITISTQEPPAGFKYGQGNPRPWTVTIAERVGPFALSSPLPSEFQVPELLADTGASGGQPVQPQPTQPQNIQAPQVNTMPQPMQQQAVAQGNPMMQPAPLPTQPAIPDGMDPAVAAAMQAIGATNVQPVAGPYDEDTPF